MKIAIETVTEQPLAVVLERVRQRDIAYDYRGYGRSGGTPSEAGVYRDVEAAYDSLALPQFTPRCVRRVVRGRGVDPPEHGAAMRRRRCHLNVHDDA